MIRWSLAIFIGVAVAWLAYTNSLSAGQRGRVALLAFLRAAAVALVAALLLGAPAAPSRPAPPIMALDVSASWRRAAGDDSAALQALRREWEAAATAENGDILLVGDSLRDAPHGSVRALVPDDAASRVRPAVDRAAALGRPLLLVTDGDVDDPESLADAPPGSRVRVPARAAKPDVGLAELTAPMAANAGDTVQVSMLLASGAAGSPEGTVRLTLDGAEMSESRVPALGTYTSTRVTMPLALPRGTRTAVIEAALQVAGDVEPRNDVLRAAIEIGDRPPAVFVSTAPDLDVREALVVLRGALSLPTRAYLRIAPGVWREEGSLTPIREDDVRARAAAAGLLIVHGDTSWTPARPGSMRAARALWIPAPPTALARAGETARAAEWYASGAPRSPLASALAGLPWDSLPPLTVASPLRSGTPVLEAKLGRRGDAVAAIALREDGGLRTLVISGSGYAGWSLRGGRSAQAFTALWGAIFDWLAAGRGDQRSARPALAWQRAGEPVRWRRGGSDSLVNVLVARRADGAGTAAGAADTVRVRFVAGAMEAVSAPLSAGVYDVRAPGGTAVLVIDAAREWVPRAPSVRDASLSRGALSSDAPRLSDAWWPFVAALLLLCAEWVARRTTGLR